MNAALFFDNPDPRTYVSLVPTSAVTGEGMGNLLAMIVQACEGPLHKRLVFSQQLLATVLEVSVYSSSVACVIAAMTDEVMGNLLSTFDDCASVQ